MSVVDPVRDGRGWAFRDGPGCTPDPVNGFTLLREAYEATEPGYDGHVSVPVLWDKQTGRIVSNNFPDITIDLGTQFGQWASPAYDLYPAALRPEIDALNERIYATVNNGVYRCGFATSQEAYNSAVASLFATLDDLDQRLATRRYLVGDALTEADVRLWVTLARFDAVYVTHFKANLRRLADYPNLWPYARDLYSIPAFGGTTDFDQIKRHYYGTHPQLNPLRIVPAGPILDWDAPQQRAALARLTALTWNALTGGSWPATPACASARVRVTAGGGAHDLQHRFLLRGGRPVHGRGDPVGVRDEPDVRLAVRGDPGHGPAGEQALAGRAGLDHGDVLVPRIGLDRGEQRPDRGFRAFQDLREPVPVDQQGPGDLLLLVVRPRDAEQSAEFGLAPVRRDLVPAAVHQPERAPRAGSRCCVHGLGLCVATFAPATVSPPGLVQQLVHWRRNGGLSLGQAAAGSLRSW